MKYLNNTICAVALVYSLIAPNFSFAGEPNKERNPASSTKHFPSRNSEGLIGITEESPFDNPVDNIFHVDIKTAVSSEDKVWLVYELEGVEDHTGISRSINDQVSVGGYLVKTRRGWATQREQVSSAWLRKGDNIVRFTMPENAQHSYRVKNLRFEIESPGDGKPAAINIVFNQPSSRYFFDKAYLKGFVSGIGSKNVAIKIDGNAARMFNGEFESIIDFSTAQNSCSIEVEAIYPDGTTTCHMVNFEEPQQADFNFTLENYTYRTEKYFDASKKENLSINGASLFSTVHALKANATLSITTLREVDIPALDAGMVNVTKNHAGFRFLPHGTVFNKELNVQLPYDLSKIPDGYTEQDIRTYYFDEQSHHWVPLALDTVLIETGEVVSKTLHFTDMINGIIKVPESPEVEAYNSTSMKGIKAANPTAGINLINPPQANNTGSASLGYPINIPAGRGGMQPQLAINYRSGSGNGWMGLGWNLSIPAITIDTRWGVPRYDPLKETETYTLNGEQLTPVAHRGLHDRYPDGQQFHPRVEGAFQRIIRRGTSPENYWWEVTDKNGTKYFYGAVAPGSLDASAVLTDNEANKPGIKKNIAFWALREVRDLNGNGVKYHYAKVMDTGLAPTTAANEIEEGHQIYIDRISYTEHHGSDAKYEIIFTRDREITSPSFARRSDVMIAGNLGFKQVTADLLMKIEVQFENKNVRHYKFNYQKGGSSINFFKTLLTSISEYDAADSLFNTHTFEYYNDVAPDGTLKPFKDVPDTWNPQDDGIHGEFINPFDKFNDDATALSGSKSWDFRQGLAVTVGSVSGSLWSKCNTIGGNFGMGRSGSEGMLTMIDINGDGLSDKVFLKDGAFKYRPNLFGKEATMEFGPEVTVTGMGVFQKEKTKSTSYGLEAVGCYGGGTANIGKGWSNSKSTTSVYFTDANGDQLPDIVKNGVVYFNHLDPENGEVTYSRSSGGTPNEIGTGGNVAGGDSNVDEAELEKARNANPLHDMVRMWIAPYTGKVKVTAPVQLLQSGFSDRSENPADGVQVTIQHQANNVGNSLTISENDYSEHQLGIDSIEVNKGDRIFFRLQSVENGSYDSVRWSPVIEYFKENTELTDANRKPLYTFSSQKDFLLSGNQEIETPVPGKVMIAGAFKKPKTTDDVRFQIIRKRASAANLMVFDKNYKWNIEVDSAILEEVDVQKGDVFQFKIISETNVNVTALSWTPHIYYTLSTDPANSTVLDKNGNPMVNFYPVPDFAMFPLVHKITKPWKLAANDDTTITVKPSFGIDKSTVPFTVMLNGIITFSVKKKDTLLWKTNITITNGELPASLPSATVEARTGDTLYFEYNSARQILAASITEPLAQLTINGTIKNTDAGVFSTYRDDLEDPIYGHLYRGWGQFAYNGNPDRKDRAIDLSLLQVSQKAKDAKDLDVENDIQDPDDVEGSSGYDPAKEMFMIMVPSAENKNWMGYDNFTILSGTVMSSSRLGEDDLVSAFTSPGGGGGADITPAIDKITKTSGSSFGLGLGYKAVGGGYNSAKNDTEVLSDFMDMNGDRFPDIVTKDFIQFTNTLGILGEVTPHGNGHHHETKSVSEGASLSGTMVESKANNNSSNIKKALVSVGNAAAGNGISGDYGEGKSEVPFSWLDINGDGLPDKVRRNGNAGPKDSSQDFKVSLNLGYKFGAEETWKLVENHINGSSSVSFGGGIGFSFASGSLNAGIGASRSENETTGSLEDINGDGLVDELLYSKDNAVKVKLNSGAGFQSAIDWTGAVHINENYGTSESINIAFTGCIPIPVIGIRICINPSTSVGHGTSKELTKFTDINGDGFPDYVHSEKDNDLKVKPSTIGRTNLLKAVHRPLGASFSMTYNQLPNSFEMPNSPWVMDTVLAYDGFANDGVDTMMTTCVYEGGYHDRHERDFYGFNKVVTNTHDTGKKATPVYTTVTQIFSNSNYYNKGLLLSETMTDGTGNRFVEKENVYEFKNILTGDELTSEELTKDAGNAFPALVETRQKFYEGQPEAGKSTYTTFAYNETGDVTTYTDAGDEGDEDDIAASIEYHKLTDLYVIGRPEQIVVTGSGIILRKRQSEIDPNTGSIIQIKQYLSESEISVHDMEYDEFGNLKKITRPENAIGQRFSVDYVYDDEVHTYPVKISNSYGYISEASYDFSFGQKLSSKDMNGNEVTYELDNVGRVVEITGPYEKGGSGYTIKFEYHPEGNVPWALTRHFDPSAPKNDLLTAIFVDGLGRILQTKKDVALYAGEGKPDTEMMTVSGRVFFDALGRTVKAFYPVISEATTPGLFVEDPDKEADPTLTAYDVLNRPLNVTLPDESVTSTQYGFEQDKFGKKQFSTKTTDANGKQTEQFTDVKGRVSSVKNYTSEDAVWTSFKYNAMGEQIEATDDLGHTTFSLYDNFGRRTERKHPDAGVTTYRYDLAGNLTELITANLAKEGLAINYTYDFERLEEITYPKNPENNVKYTYGEPGATDNRTGRIVLQEDAAGAQEFFYGPFGEVVRNVRTVIIPQHDEQTYVTEWKYDTWNRLTSMTYADGEVVTYNYNQGGLLRNMTGKKKNSSYNYVNQLGYDKFEQRVFLAYGNGTKATYGYEADRRRLENMTAQTSTKRVFMDNVYGYDKVNNILNLKNNAPIPSANLMGGASEYSYNYDDLYRLTSAQGHHKGANDEHSYTLAMSYNSVGGITQKTQVHKRKDQEQKKTTYDLNYTYGSEQPHAPIHIGEQTYTYDANGNQIGWSSDVSGQRRNILWDEENRVRGIYDNGALYHYVYDASGERVLKGRSTGQRIFVNGEWKAGSGSMGNYTVYVNPYLVLRSGGYTKHYYIEAQRIVSKLGGGWDNNGKGPLKAGDGKVDYVGKGQKVFDGIVKNLKFLGADGQILTAGKSGKIPPGQIKGTSGGSVTEAFRYFYHPDHLGSTSYVTDASGEVFQHLEYVAFGETFVEEHSNTDRTPYLFNGKELDEETGLYYYGARYYDARTSAWLSVDPLAEKYPAHSPYNYTMNNPINATDPDGKVVIFVNGYWGFPTKACCGGTAKHWDTDWVSSVQKQIGDSKARFYDGSSDWTGKTGGSSRISTNIDAANRYKYGYMQGKKDAAEIVGGLEKGESIKFVTSSMGAAYSRGMSKAIVDYVDAQNSMIDAHNASLEKNADGTYKNPSLAKERLNVTIEFTVDLDPFQGKQTGADPNSDANYYMLNDGPESNFVGNSVPGSKQIGLDKNGKTRMHGHHPSWAPADAFPKSNMNGTGSSSTENPTN